jgi:hypothetical protein
MKCSSLSPFSLRSYVGSTIYVKGTEGIPSTILSIDVEVFPRSTVPSFFCYDRTTGRFVTPLNNDGEIRRLWCGPLAPVSVATNVKQL